MTLSAPNTTTPYFYSLNGGTPSTPLSSGNNTHLESNLAPGQYNVVIKDSSPDSCTPVTVGQTVTITEPTGGPLELTEGTITEIFILDKINLKDFLLSLNHLMYQ